MNADNKTNLQSKSFVFLSIKGAKHSRTKNYFNGMKKIGLDCMWFEIPNKNIYKHIRQINLQFKGKESVLIVANPSHILVPFIWAATFKRPIFDAGWPLYDGVIISRKEYGFLGLNLIKTYLIDFFAFNLAKVVFVESEEQKMRCVKRLGQFINQLVVVETGFDENRFDLKFNQTQIENKKIQILFRGGDLKEAGIDVLIAAISMSSLIDCNFIIISNSNRFINQVLPNTQIITKYLSEVELFNIYNGSLIALGQLSSHRRSNWTIPHKFFEAAYLGIPYLSSNNKIMGRLENEKCIYTFKGDDPLSLINALSSMLSDAAQLNVLKLNIKNLYTKKYSQSVLTKTFLDQIKY